MKESLSQEIFQRLQQKLSPMQVQFVRTLEMSAAEIEDEVRKAVDENPALEIMDEFPSDNFGNTVDDGFSESAEDLRKADYTNDDLPSYRLEASNHSRDDQWFEPTAVVAGKSLQQSLLEQMSSLSLSDREKIIGEYIIGNIDDSGYLTRSSLALVDDLALQTGLEVGLPELRSVISKVKELDPPGVGAYDLRECLLLQLKRKRNSVAVATAREIITHYFDLFSHKHFSQLKAALEIDDDALSDALAEIRQLNPKPGAPVDEHPSESALHQITPDFSVEVEGENITVSVVNNLPQLQIEQTFNIYDIPISDRSSNREREAYGFIKRKYDEASSFIKILQMRQETLYRVMTAIVKVQKQFFLTGDPTTIRPMILKDISKLTGYDLSVISRATSGKYVATDYGIYPLKFFFNERPKSDADTSSHELMAIIKEIIEKEDKNHPMSDEDITAELNRKGYQMARRTVAKYRERAGIPVARLRKDI